MSPTLKTIDRDSGVPIFGLDFLGIIDRGTNIIEIKPITQCNLQCKYCFVSAGEFCTNFQLALDFLINGVEKLVKIKGAHDLEVHIAPYGEALLFPPLVDFIQQVTRMSGISTISMQTNGLLLDEKKVDTLAAAGLTRFNISLNTLDEAQAAQLADVPSYNMQKLLAVFDHILSSAADLLLAPVWFPKINDGGIVDIIKYVKEKRSEGYSDKKLQLGIQKYLTYKTGRRLGKIRPKTWDYFYNQLHSLEKTHGIKLILKPSDFGIHRRDHLMLPLTSGEKSNAEIIMQGRYSNEWIGRINDAWAIKILSRANYQGGEKVPIIVQKANSKESLVTGIVRN